jgi:hypothetical protein
LLRNKELILPQWGSGRDPSGFPAAGLTGDKYRHLQHACRKMTD